MQAEKKSNTGKSYEDYRNIIKQLKIKVKRLQQKNEEYEEQIHQTKAQILQQGDPLQIAMQQNLGATKIQATFKGTQERKAMAAQLQDQDKSFDMENSDQAMTCFYQAAQKLGMNLEMFFRAADVEGKNMIFLDDFRMFLNKINIGHSASQITRLLYLFDEDCSGKITKDNYNDTLCAYGVNSEKVSERTRTMGQETLLVFAKLLKDKKIDPNKAFTEMAKASPNQFIAQELSDYFKKLSDRVSRKDRAALFFYFDCDKLGYVSKKHFLNVIEKAMKSMEPQQQQLSPNKMQLDATNAMGLMNQSGFICETANKKQQLKVRTRVIVDKFEQKTKVPFTVVLESLISHVGDVNHGIVFSHLQQEFVKFPNAITLQEIFLIFRLMDSNDENGVVNFAELHDFYMDAKKPGYSSKFFIINLARTLQQNQVSTQKYFNDNGIDEQATFTENEFGQKGAQAFKVYKEEATKMYKEQIDVKKTGNVLGSQIIDLVDSQRSDVKNKFQALTIAPTQATLFASQAYDMGDQSMMPSTSTVQRSVTKKKTLLLQKTNVNQQFQQFEALLNKICPVVNKQHLFKNPNNDFTYQTIFTDPMSCLRTCYELIKPLMGAKEQNGKQKKWIDPEFGPSNIYDQNYNKENQELGFDSLYFYENTVQNGLPTEGIEWLTLEQIQPDAPAKFSFELVANDVLQSQFLGNCWFASAMSIIASRDQLIIGGFKADNQSIEQIDDRAAATMINGVYPYIFQFLQPYGMYVMRFFKNYKWLYVIIDEKLAVLTATNEIMFGHCTPEPGFSVCQEFWVSLIEKAYAKLHNCYQALNSGYIDEGLTDMTGFASEKIQIQPSMSSNPAAKQELWESIIRYLRQKCLLGCSRTTKGGPIEGKIQLDNEDTGLMAGHAYAILDAFELNAVDGQTYRLIRARNPWGWGEWKLDWSDADDKLQSNMESVKKHYIDERLKNHEIEEFTTQEDGTFLIEFSDWVRVFDNIFITIDFAEEWEGKRVHDQWQEGKGDGGFPCAQTDDQFLEYAENNQYYFKASKDCQLFISCGQTDGRLMRGLTYPYNTIVHPFNCCIWKLPSGENKINKFDKKNLLKHSGMLKVCREVCIPTFKLTKGEYVIIPSTKDKGMHGDYNVSVYYNLKDEEVELYKIGDKSVEFQDILEVESDVIKTSKEYKDMLKVLAQITLATTEKLV